jgi:serine/threonine protein kinase
MQRCQEPGCGHLNRPSARFCEKCGQTLRMDGWSPLQAGHMMRGGAYRILEPLGKGGMGALYLAADTGAFDRRCVVKELLDYYDPTDTEEADKAQSRFETEARLLAELSHPGIPRIYSYFSEAGRHYIVMEYIEGETLERAVTHVDLVGRHIPARPLPAEQIVRHAIRVCQVLEYLADRPRSVIHHDIKPANLIIDKTSGEVRLVDFGTAQAWMRWATRARLGEVSSLFGTEGYAAPEQFQGRSEPRSDVYALASTAYHLLTDDDPGDHPFQFPEMDSLPGPLADALGRALRPEVGRRSTALEFRQALESWLIPEDGSQPFVFQGGAVAHTTEELVALCDQYWLRAREHLVAGDFDQWFRARNRHDLVAKAKSARLEGDADAALEVFLRRLNPRLLAPRLAVQPQTVDLGRVSRDRPVTYRLRVRNKTRGYGQASFTSSVPWLQPEPIQVGCRAGAEVEVTLEVDTARLPLRKDHQAVLNCVPLRGARISIPVTAQLNLVQEVFQRFIAASGHLGRLAHCGARKGLALWTGTFRSLVRSRYGPWVLLSETLVLAGVMVALWWSWRGLPADLGRLIVAFFQALPLALLAVYALPALTFVGGAVVWEMVRSVAKGEDRRGGHTARRYRA